MLESMQTEPSAVAGVRSAKRLALALAVVLAAPMPRSAVADDGWASRDYQFATRQLNEFTERFRNDLVDPIARGVREKRPPGAARPATQEAAALTSAPVAAPVVPAELAAHYPPEKRAQIEHYFAQLLDGYAQVEKKLGLPRNDLPGALASFIAGSYMAYTNIPFPDEHYKPLLGQMRGILANDPAFTKASKADKQAMFEHLAILGMLMATTQLALQKQPDAQRAANMHHAAKSYLERLLRTDAERVRIDAQGLSIRPRVR